MIRGEGMGQAMAKQAKLRDEVKALKKDKVALLKDVTRQLDEATDAIKERTRERDEALDLLALQLTDEEVTFQAIEELLLKVGRPKDVRAMTDGHG